MSDDQVHWDDGEIVVNRKKEGRELQVAPLMPATAQAIREELADRKRLGVKLLDKRVFWWHEDPSWPVSNSQVTHWHRAVCQAARINDFWARDFRHQFATRWAHDPRITDSMLKLMMGHSQSSNMRKSYCNVGEGSIGSVVGEKS